MSSKGGLDISRDKKMDGQAALEQEEAKKMAVTGTVLSVVEEGSRNASSHSPDCLTGWLSRTSARSCFRVRDEWRPFRR